MDTLSDPPSAVNLSFQPGKISVEENKTALSEYKNPSNSGSSSSALTSSFAPPNTIRMHSAVVSVPNTLPPFASPAVFSTLLPHAVSANPLMMDIPPPLPVPKDSPSTNISSTTTKKETGVSQHHKNGPTATAAVSDMSGDSLMTQFAGHVINTAMGNSTSGRAGSRGPEPVNSRKRNSPEKQQVDPRAISGLISTHPRLKVEDALCYLDRVKMIFLPKPKVYNDFLDIMKEFKSQSLDTPGVINRVANLFHGHRELIVGFNAFLPHGYRIEIGNDEIVRVTVPGNQVLTISDIMRPPSPISAPVETELEAAPRVKSQSPTSTVSADSDEDESQTTEEAPKVSSLPEAETYQPSDIDILCSTADMAKTGSEGDRQSIPRTSTPTVLSKGVEFDYAISYVNKIKARFNDEPTRYKKFLEILHAYQGKIRLSGDKPLDETDVFKEVGRLFNDHPDLMDDFSRFLPNACAMAGPMISQGSASNRVGSPSRSPSSSPQLPTGRGQNKLSKTGKVKAEKSGKHHQGSSRDDSGKPSKLDRRTRVYKDKMKQELAESLKSPSKKFNKFRGKETRKSDSVDSARKFNKNGASVEKLSRNRIEDVPPQLPNQLKINKPASGRSVEDISSPEEATSKLPKGKRQIYRVPFTIPTFRKRNKRLLSPSKAFQRTRVVSPAEALNFTTLDNFSLVDRIRRAVPLNVFTVVIKLFETYTSRAITKGKLLEIMEKLLHHKPKLVQEFATLLQTKAVIRAGVESAVEETNMMTRPRMSEPEYRRNNFSRLKDYDNRVAETDFKAFERYTDSRSYRIRPDTLPKLKSSGSTELDLEVLNDKYISCPIFSEGSQFLIAKKNSAEEVMFKCEDEKYEMDMLLAGAEAAIDAMSCMMDSYPSGGLLSRKLIWEEAYLHRRIVTKLYTDNAPTIMSHLINNPLSSIPTVLERLKQKHAQWIRVQNAMGEIWMEQAQRNASKIGDYKGATFKATDMRFLRSRHLVHEMEKVYNERIDSVAKIPDSKKQKIDTSGPVTGGELISRGVEATPHLTVKYPKSLLIIDDVTFFILRYIKQCAAFAKSDKKLMNKFLLEYAFRSLRMPDSSDVKESGDSSDDETHSDKRLNGSKTVPRLSPSSAEDDSSSGDRKRHRNHKSDASDDEVNDFGEEAKKFRSNGLREFPIAPLPWPELCQYSGELRPPDNQVDEDLMSETKKREQNRDRISRKLCNLGAELPNEEKNYLLIYGNSPFFLFVRYHQILCDRLNTLFKSFQNLLTVVSGKMETPCYIVSKACKPKLDLPVERFWIVFIDRLLKLLDGNIDPGTYEDEMREIFRKDAYLSFTLDRLIQSTCRQLHHIVNQERAKTIRDFWEDARSVGGAGGPLATASERLDSEKQYESKVAEFLKEQNCFKVIVYDSGRITMDLIDSEEPEDQQPLCRNWKDFLSYYSAATNLDESIKEKLLLHTPIFITRQHRQLSRHRKQSSRTLDDEEEEEDEDLALDVTKLSDPEVTTDLSLDDKTWLMSLNIRSQIESEDILGLKDDRAPNTEWLIYRRGALQTANESHRRVTQRRTAAFKRFMAEKWSKKASITQEKHKAFLSQMRDNLIRYKQGNSVDPPYFVYHVCKSDESERLENVKPIWISVTEREGTAGEAEKEEDTAADSAQSDSSEDDTETDVEPKVKRTRKKISIEGI